MKKLTAPSLRKNYIRNLVVIRNMNVITTNTNHLIFITISGLLMLLSLTSCNSSTPTTITSVADTTNQAPPSNSREKVKTFFTFNYQQKDMPSPANIIQELSDFGAAYDKTILNDGAHAPGIPANDKMAVNLGIYVMDMMYSVDNSMGVMVMEYSRALAHIAERLQLQTTTNNSFTKRLEANATERDSIFKLSDDLLINSSSDLMRQKQNYFVACIYTGAWMEAMHINASIYSRCKDAVSKEKSRGLLYNQKTVLEGIIKSLKEFSKNNGELVLLLKDFEEIYKMVNSEEQSACLTEEKFLPVAQKLSDLRTRLVN